MDNKCYECDCEGAILRSRVDRLLCDNCVDRHYIVCEDCNELCREDDSYSVSTGMGYNMICSSCWSNSYFHCDDCGEYRHNDRYARDGYCEYCVENSDDEGRLNERPYKNSAKLLGKEIGNTILSTRPFGIELEAFSTQIDDLQEALPKFIGIENDGSI